MRGMNNTNNQPGEGNMGLKELAKYIGGIGLVRLHGDLLVSVNILDVRVRFGQVDYYVSPYTGTGKSWIASTSFENITEK